MKRRRVKEHDERTWSRPVTRAIGNLVLSVIGGKTSVSGHVRTPHGIVAVWHGIDDPIGAPSRFATNFEFVDGQDSRSWSRWTFSATGHTRRALATLAHRFAKEIVGA